MASVDCDDGAGRETRQIAGQKRREGSDVIWLAGWESWVSQFLPALGIAKAALRFMPQQAHQPVGFDGAGVNAHDSNTVLHRGAAQRAGESVVAAILGDNDQHILEARSPAQLGAKFGILHKTKQEIIDRYGL